MSNRFLPAWCATLALVGCLIPDKESLVTLPAGYTITLDPHGNPMAADLAKTMYAGIESAKPYLDEAWWLSLLVYAVPLSAFAILIATLRGVVSERLQIASAAIWLVIGILWPIVTNGIALHGLEQIKLLALNVEAFGAPLRFNTGDWLILFAAGILLLAANGIIKIAETL